MRVSGTGRCDVTSWANPSVAYGSETQLVLMEEGTWSSGPFSGARFRNRYRWTFEKDGVILEHLRRGDDSPVKLVRLVPTANSGKKAFTLVSTEPHQCGEDSYQAEITLLDSEIHVCWLIDGPRKRQRLIARYQ